MKKETLLKWCTEELLPTVVKNETFSEKGRGQTLKSCEFESFEKYISSFASAPCFAKLKVISESGTISHDVLIKFQNQNSVFREKMRTIPQFENEVNFYNQVIPCFKEFLKFCGHSPEYIEKVIPKCYFASNGNEDPEKAIVILEDLRNLGFRMSNSAIDLDFQHFLVAIDRLARFHALTFSMKYRKWQLFEKLKTLFVDVWLADDPACRQLFEDFHGYVCQRGINYLLGQKDSKVPKEYLEKIRETLKPIFDFLRSVRAPKEPLSVICHGDFNRNNILFRYDNGKVVDARLIDYQGVIYGPPSLDLGFLIYMNSTLEFRERHFNEIFYYYYSNLIKNVSSIIAEDEKTISDWIPIQAFKEDFERVALYHYNNVVFFLPIMMTPPDDEFEDDIKYKTFREMAEKNYKKGGEVVSKRISEVLLDFYRRKFYV